MNVTGKFGCIFINFDKYGLVPTLKQVTGAFSFYVEIRCVWTVYMSHDLRKFPTGVSIKR